MLANYLIERWVDFPQKAHDLRGFMDQLLRTRSTCKTTHTTEPRNPAYGYAGGGQRTNECGALAVNFILDALQLPRVHDDIFRDAAYELSHAEANT